MKKDDLIINYEIADIPCLHRIHLNDNIPYLKPHWIQWKIGLSINLGKLMERINQLISKLKQKNYNFTILGKIPITFDDGYKDVLIFNKLLKEEDFLNYIQPIFFIPSSLITEEVLILWFDKLYLILSNLSYEDILLVHNRYEMPIKDSTHENLMLNLANGNLKSKLRDYSNSQQNNILNSLIEEFNIKINPKKTHDMLYLNKDEVSKLINNDWILGSHGKFHHRFKNITLECLKEDLRLSFQTIIKMGGNSFLSFPDGKFNNSIIEICNKVGFTHLFTLYQNSKVIPSNVINRVIWE